MKPSKSTPFRSHSCIATIFTMALLTHFAAPSASALTYYWDNDGATAGFGIAAGTWTATTIGSATEGWSQDGTGATEPVSVTTTTGDTLNFGNAATGLATGSIAVSGTVITNKLTFATGSGAITLAGGTIALGGTAPSITINKGGQVIGSALTLNANTSVVIGTSGASVASLNGAIGGTGNLTITTGIAVNGSTGTNTGITLGGASTYSGTTLITAGDNDNVMNVKAAVANALPVTTVLTLSGGTAGAGSGRQISYDLVGNNQTLAGLTNVTLSARPQRILNSTGTATLTINNTSPASSTFAGNINGTGLSLAKIGTGTQILGAGNTLSGTTTISGGKLVGVVGGNCASSKVIIDNTLGTFGISVTDNTKTWTCKELAPTAAGEIEFSFGAVIPSTTVSPLTITVPTLLTGLADFAAATPKVRVNTAAGLDPGTYPLMTWDIVSGTIPTTADLIPPTLLPQTAATLEVSGNTLNLVITSTAVSVVKANNTNNLNLGTSWVGGLAPDAVKTAVWDSTVTAANTTILGTDVTWGGIAIANPSGPVTINAGNTLTLGAAAIDIDLSTATADLTLNCPLALGADSIWEIAPTQTLTVAGPITGAFPITKQGNGKTVLSSGSNSYTGNTTLTAGTLQLGADNVIPDGIGNGNVSATGTLDLNGKSETINGLSGAGIIDNTLAATSPILTVGANDQTSTFGGIIQDTSGTLNLVKTGTGSLVLGGANTLSGSVTVNGGTLAYSNTAPLDSASGITLAGGTTLRPDVAGATVAPPITVGATGTIATITTPSNAGSGSTAVPVTIASGISGDGKVTFLGINGTNAYGTIILKAPSTYAGSTLMNTLDGYAGAPDNNANIFVRLDVDNALPTTTAVKLDGGDGAGGGRFCELNLNGSNQTLTGLENVAVTLRTQRVCNKNTGDSSVLTINNATDFTYSAFLGSSTTAGFSNFSLIKSGVGKQSFTGATGYSGNTTVSQGILSLGVLNEGTINNNTSTVTIAASGATLDLTFVGSDTVDKLFIGATQQPVGTYGAVGSTLPVIGIPQITGTGTLTVTTGPVAGGFSSWITGTFTNGTVPGGQQGPNADFDNDGISNLVEYAVAGQDPTVPNASVGTFSSNLLSYSKRLDATGLTYAIQESTDLGIADNWTEVGSYTTNSASTISYTMTPSTPVKNFARLQVLSN